MRNCKEDSEERVLFEETIITYKNEIQLKNQMESHPFDCWLRRPEEIDFPIEIRLQCLFFNNFIDTDQTNYWKREGCNFMKVLNFVSRGKQPSCFLLTGERGVIFIYYCSVKLALPFGLCLLQGDGEGGTVFVKP